MLRQNRSCIKWHFLLVGLFFIIMHCDARAVNVSNTWTMPQEGLNVFYRFFRDRISWFEADAVCQFHHANLVTVDNSFQFDATRDLLRELDVNDIVWIGLMRPQSSDRFMWSNSRPLVADTGYWAESLPLMDAPLCAVIDPIRDYRWHALRCGGPETASFLCEMPVPSWADACNLKDMPNLTLQYMADTASIELIRNCQEEGLLRTMCRGKQDRERALQDLICPRERLEAQRINDITNSHFKSLQIINSIPSDNNENNNIELLPMELNYGPHYPGEVQTEKNTVQRLIEQFNVDELMQADEPSNMDTVSSFYKIPDLIPKPVKKSAKKVLDYPKKDNGKQKSTDLNSKPTQEKDKKVVHTQMEDMMMGDQPEMPEQFLKEEVSNEILEPLPHIKKTNIHREDGLDKVEQEATALKKIMQKAKEIESKKSITTSFTTSTTTTAPIMTEPAKTSTTTISSLSGFSTEMLLTTTPAVSTLKAEELPQFREIHKHKHNSETHTELDSSWGHLTTTTSAVTIGHPIHPQQPHSNVLNEENQHPHTKGSADSSHFIPPMLMVKSHYVPSAGKHGHPEHDHHHQHQQQQQKHLQPHSEITTEEHAETLLKQQPNENPAETKIMVTTPKVVDLQQTTLKILDTSISKLENETPPAEHQITLATAERSSGIKPITEQYTTETEQSNVSQNLNSEESQNKMTTTTLQPAATTTAKTIANAEVLSLLVTDFKEINKNAAGHERNRDERQELKSPQTTHTDAETTQTTTTAEYAKEAKNLEPATDNAAKIKNAADITNLKATMEIKQQQIPRIEEKLTAIKNEESKEDLQTTTGTTEKLVATQTSAVITASTTVSAPITQQTSTTTKTEAQTLQQIEKEQTSQEELEEDMAKDQDKKETIVKTTEIPVTSTAIIKAQEQEEDTPAIVTTNTTTTYLTLTKRTDIVETTTVKPITTTILPQNEIKSTETSFSFASTATTATTNTPTAEYISSTTTIKPSTTTTIMPYTITATTEAEDKAATAKAGIKGEASTPTSPPETTRNFLKVTTEIPFKPNRRRSLTKPETVSYMKKILG